MSSLLNIVLEIEANKLEKSTFTRDIESSGAKVIKKNHRGNYYKYNIELPSELLGLFLENFSKTDTYEFVSFQRVYDRLQLINNNKMVWTQKVTGELFHSSSAYSFSNEKLYKEYCSVSQLITDGFIAVKAIPCLYEGFNKEFDETYKKAEYPNKDMLFQAWSLIRDIGELVPIFDENNLTLYSERLNVSVILDKSDPAYVLNLFKSGIDKIYVLHIEHSFPCYLAYQLEATEEYKVKMHNDKQVEEELKKKVLGDLEETKKVARNKMMKKVHTQQIGYGVSVVRWKNSKGKWITGLLDELLEFGQTPEEWIYQKFLNQQMHSGMGQSVWVEKIPGEAPLRMVYHTVDLDGEKVEYHTYAVPQDKLELLYIYEEEEVKRWILDFHKKHTVPELKIAFNYNVEKGSANAGYSYNDHTIFYNMTMLRNTIVRNFIEKGITPHTTVLLIAAHESGHADKSLFEMYDKFNVLVPEINKKFNQLPRGLFGDIETKLCDGRHIDILKEVIPLSEEYYSLEVENEFLAWKNGRKLLPKSLWYFYDLDNWGVLSNYRNKQTQNVDIYKNLLREIVYS